MWLEQVRKENAAEKEALPYWEEDSAVLVCAGDLEEAWNEVGAAP